MKKIKGNRGAILPHVLVLVVILTVMTTGLVSLMRFEGKKHLNIVEKTSIKIELENRFYEILNEIVLTNNSELLISQTVDDIYLLEVQKVDLTYQFKFYKKTEKISLEGKVVFSQDYQTYEIKAWGFRNG